MRSACVGHLFASFYWERRRPRRPGHRGRLPVNTSVGLVVCTRVPASAAGASEDAGGPSEGTTRRLSYYYTGPGNHHGPEAGRDLAGDASGETPLPLSKSGLAWH